MPVSPDTLLRRAKKATSPSPPTPRVLGVDDFAFRRGHTYGTLLLDLETHQPVDLLEDRSPVTFAEWLRHHPGVEIINRDRSKAYRRGATDGAPQAQQVIDRWHGLKNLRETIERFLSHTQMPAEIEEEVGQATPLRQKRTRGEQACSQGSRQRRLALYEHVVELSKQGGSIQGIARQLQISRQTGRKFVQAPHFPEQQKHAQTTSAIDPYRAYLHKRWQEGCQTTGQLWEEIQKRGFTGSWMMVYRWVQLQQGRSVDQSQPKTRTIKCQMAPRQFAWLFLLDPDQLEEQEKQTLTHLRQEPRIELAYLFPC